MSLIAGAKGKLRELVKYERDEAAPRNPPASAAATLLFVAPIGPTRRAPVAGIGEEAPPAVFLAVARGILYAIDEDGGTLLWAVRVGADISDPPTVARVELGEGPTDLAIVASNVAGEAAVAGYVVKTGAARWYQPLPAPAAGPAVVVGTRAYVALRDALGTIYEFDITTGTRRGRIRLGQPAGLNGIAVRPGTGLLYAAADARRVYVIEAGARDDNGALLDPQCVQVIATGHLPGTLRTPPLLLGPEGEAPGERWMILSQADGRTMQLRAFSLVPIQPLSADGKVPPELPVTPVVELSINGWVWFPPVSDGERLALATDFGQLRFFGVKQFEGLDSPLFPLPEPRPPLPVPPEGRALRGLVFAAEEAAFWVVANGNLQKFRVGLVPSRGVEIISVGPTVHIGEPTQPPQLNNRRDAACLVVRSLNSAGCKAVLLNFRDGELRWQRQLGVVPATQPIVQGDGLLLVAEDGGMVVVPAASGASAGRSVAAPVEWVIATPPENATGPTVVAVSADGMAVFTVTPVLAREDQRSIATFVVRRVAEGKIVHEGNVAAPAALAGPPVVLGNSLLLPLADGFVYRHAARHAAESGHARRRSAMGRRSALRGRALPPHTALSHVIPHRRWRKEVDEVGLARRREVESDGRDLGIARAAGRSGNRFVCIWRGGCGAVSDRGHDRERLAVRIRSCGATNSPVETRRWDSRWSANLSACSPTGREWPPTRRVHRGEPLPGLHRPRQRPTSVGHTRRSRCNPRRRAATRRFRPVDSGRPRRTRYGARRHDGQICVFSPDRTPGRGAGRGRVNARHKCDTHDSLRWIRGRAPLTGSTRGCAASRRQTVG